MFVEDLSKKAAFCGKTELVYHIQNILSQRTNNFSLFFYGDRKRAIINPKEFDLYVKFKINGSWQKVTTQPVIQDSHSFSITFDKDIALDPYGGERDQMWFKWFISSDGTGKNQSEFLVYALARDECDNIQKSAPFRQILKFYHPNFYFHFSHDKRKDDIEESSIQKKNESIVTAIPGELLHWKASVTNQEKFPTPPIVLSFQNKNGRFFGSKQAGVLSFDGEEQKQSEALKGYPSVYSLFDTVEPSKTVERRFQEIISNKYCGVRQTYTVPGYICKGSAYGGEKDTVVLLSARQDGEIVEPVTVETGFRPDLLDISQKLTNFAKDDQPDDRMLANITIKNRGTAFQSPTLVFQLPKGFIVDQSFDPEILIYEGKIPVNENKFSYTIEQEGKTIRFYPSVEHEENLLILKSNQVIQAVFAAHLDDSKANWDGKKVGFVHISGLDSCGRYSEVKQRSEPFYVQYPKLNFRVENFDFMFMNFSKKPKTLNLIIENNGNSTVRDLSLSIEAESSWESKELAQSCHGELPGLITCKPLVKPLVSGEQIDTALRISSVEEINNGSNSAIYAQLEIAVQNSIGQSTGVVFFSQHAEIKMLNFLLKQEFKKMQGEDGILGTGESTTLSLAASWQGLSASDRVDQITLRQFLPPGLVRAPTAERRDGDINGKLKDPPEIGASGEFVWVLDSLEQDGTFTADIDVVAIESHSEKEYVRLDAAFTMNGIALKPSQPLPGLTAKPLLVQRYDPPLGVKIGISDEDGSHKDDDIAKTLGSNHPSILQFTITNFSEKPLSMSWLSADFPPWVTVLPFQKDGLDNDGDTVIDEADEKGKTIRRGKKIHFLSLKDYGTKAYQYLEAGESWVFSMAVQLQSQYPQGELTPIVLQGAFVPYSQDGYIDVPIHSIQRGILLNTPAIVGKLIYFHKDQSEGNNTIQQGDRLEQQVSVKFPHGYFEKLTIQLSFPEIIEEIEVDSISFTPGLQCRFDRSPQTVWKENHFELQWQLHQCRSSINDQSVTIDFSTKVGMHGFSEGILSDIREYNDWKNYLDFDLVLKLSESDKPAFVSGGHYRLLGSHIVLVMPKGLHKGHYPEEQVKKKIVLHNVGNSPSGSIRLSVLNTEDLGIKCDTVFLDTSSGTANSEEKRINECGKSVYLPPYIILAGGKLEFTLSGTIIDDLHNLKSPKVVLNFEETRKIAGGTMLQNQIYVPIKALETHPPRVQLSEPLSVIAEDVFSVDIDVFLPGSKEELSVILGVRDSLAHSPMEAIKLGITPLVKAEVIMKGKTIPLSFSLHEVDNEVDHEIFRVFHKATAGVFRAQLPSYDLLLKNAFDDDAKKKITLRVWLKTLYAHQDGKEHSFEILPGLLVDNSVFKEDWIEVAHFMMPNIDFAVVADFLDKKSDRVSVQSYICNKGSTAAIDLAFQAILSDELEIVEKNYIFVDDNGNDFGAVKYDEAQRAVKFSAFEEARKLNSGQCITAGFIAQFKQLESIQERQKPIVVFENLSYRALNILGQASETVYTRNKKYSPIFKIPYFLISPAHHFDFNSEENILVHKFFIRTPDIGQTFYVDINTESSSGLKWEFFVDRNNNGIIDKDDTPFYTNIVMQKNQLQNFLMRSDMREISSTLSKDITKIEVDLLVDSGEQLHASTVYTTTSDENFEGLVAIKKIAIDRDCDGDIADESLQDSQFEAEKNILSGECGLIQISFQNIHSKPLEHIEIKDILNNDLIYIDQSAQFIETPDGLIASTVFWDETSSEVMWRYVGDMALGASGKVGYAFSVRSNTP